MYDLVFLLETHHTIIPMRKGWTVQGQERAVRGPSVDLRVGVALPPHPISRRPDFILLLEIGDLGDHRKNIKNERIDPPRTPDLYDDANSN